MAEREERDLEINAAIGLLREHGFVVTKPALLAETTMVKLRRALGLKANTLHKRLQHRDCPEWQPVLCGPSGRVIKLRLTRQAIEWLRRPLTPGKRGEVAR